MEQKLANGLQGRQRKFVLDSSSQPCLSVGEIAWFRLAVTQRLLTARWTTPTSWGIGWVASSKPDPPTMSWAIIHDTVTLYSIPVGLA